MVKNLRVPCWKIKSTFTSTIRKIKKEKEKHTKGLELYKKKNKNKK